MTGIETAFLGGWGLAERETGYMEAALCLNELPEIWFPEPPHDPTVEERDRYAREVEAAQAICAECPVREACHADAERLGVKDGIWGGVNFYVSKRQRVKGAA